MHAKTSESSQLDLFASSINLLVTKDQKKYSDPLKWHNIFRKQVVERVDEDVFSVLYCQNNGAPNYSIRVLVGMIVLKEAFVWSDSQLFDEISFNLLVRGALGLHNINDAAPARSTYYLFRKRIVEHENQGNENLFAKVFTQVTQEQIIEFEVRGESVRMDSKLIGSNIAWYSRYELIHETLRSSYKEDGLFVEHLSEEEKEKLKNIVSEEGQKVSYRSNKDEINSKIDDIGLLIYKILQHPNNQSSEKSVLQQVFEQQYKVGKDESVTARKKTEISADSIQSPHDTDCDFRNKGGNKVKGFVGNLTETCDKKVVEVDVVKEDKKIKKTKKALILNLITNIQVKPVTHSDSKFFISAIEQSQKILSNPIKSAYTDGAFHSPENQDYCEEHGINFIIPKIQGTPSRYDLSIDSNNNVVVIDTKTDKILEVKEITTTKQIERKWRIETEKGYRYFTLKDIETSMLRKEIQQIPQEELNIRNNVEATIFHFGHRYPHDKTRYRGLIKHEIWANARCLWVNCVRITNYLNKKAILMAKNWFFDTIIPDFMQNLKSVSTLTFQFSFLRTTSNEISNFKAIA